MQLIADWAHAGASKFDGLSLVRPEHNCTSPHLLAPSPNGALVYLFSCISPPSGSLVVNTVNNVHILIQFRIMVKINLTLFAVYIANHWRD